MVSPSLDFLVPGTRKLVCRGWTNIHLELRSTREGAQLFDFLGYENFFWLDKMGRAEVGRAESAQRGNSGKNGWGGVGVAGMELVLLTGTQNVWQWLILDTSLKLRQGSLFWPTLRCKCVGNKTRVTVFCWPPKRLLWGLSFLRRFTFQPLGGAELAVVKKQWSWGDKKDILKNTCWEAQFSF